MGDEEIPGTTQAWKDMAKNIPTSFGAIWLIGLNPKTIKALEQYSRYLLEAKAMGYSEREAVIALKMTVRIVRTLPLAWSVEEMMKKTKTALSEMTDLT